MIAWIPVVRSYIVLVYPSQVKITYSSATEHIHCWNVCVCDNWFNIAVKSRFDYQKNADSLHGGGEGRGGVVAGK